MRPHWRSGPLVIAGIVLGVGIDGFIDGIVLHEILQWHHMISNVVTPNTTDGLQTNVRADGFFLLFAWLATVVGVALLWRAGAQASVPWSPRIFVGSLLVGAGGFNVVDEVVDHLILNLHHIKLGPAYLAYDLGFTALGVILLIVGWVLLRAGQRGLALRMAREEERRRAA